MSGAVHPARLMIADCPEINPPVGLESTCVMPTTRDTPTWALCGLIPHCACAFGLKLPTSATSTVAFAPCGISESPMLVPASIMPG
jgi:hypothetical protein